MTLYDRERNLTYVPVDKGLIMRYQVSYKKNLTPEALEIAKDSDDAWSRPVKIRFAESDDGEMRLEVKECEETRFWS